MDECEAFIITVKCEGANNSWRATSKAFGEQILMGVLGKAGSLVLGASHEEWQCPKLLGWTRG